MTGTKLREVEECCNKCLHCYANHWSSIICGSVSVKSLVKSMLASLLVFDTLSSIHLYIRSLCLKSSFKYLINMSLLWEQGHSGHKLKYIWCICGTLWIYFLVSITQLTMCNLVIIKTQKHWKRMAVVYWTQLTADEEHHVMEYKN